MKKLYPIFIAILCAMCIAAPTLAKKPYPKRQTICVVFSGNLCNDDVQWLEAEFIQWLSKVPCFKVVALDESGLSVIQRVQDYQLDGLVSDDQLTKVGEFCGAKFVVDPKIRKSGKKLYMTARILSVETSKVVYSTNMTRLISSKDMLEENIKLSAATARKIMQEFQERGYIE